MKTHRNLGHHENTRLTSHKPVMRRASPSWGSTLRLQDVDLHGHLVLHGHLDAYMREEKEDKRVQENYSKTRTPENSER